jgi:hypothetical protein
MVFAFGRAFFKFAIQLSCALTQIRRRDELSITTAFVFERFS